MKTNVIRILSSASIAAGMALLMTSCSLPLRSTDHGKTSRAAQRMPTQRITQLNFGRNASFAICTEPACPVVTRKTLAITPQPTAIAPAPTVDIAATLDPGELQLKVPLNVGDTRPAPATIPRAPVVVHFASGSAKLSASAKSVLDRMLPDARKASRIVIAGRTDSAGNSSTNQALALARARTVRDYLRARLPSRGITFALDAQGACCFIVSNDTPEGRQRNRRVEIVFSAPEQVTP